MEALRDRFEESWVKFGTKNLDLSRSNEEKKKKK